MAVLLCGFMHACCYGHVKFHEAVIGPVVRVICVHVVGEWFVPIDDNFQVLVHEFFCCSDLGVFMQLVRIAG